MIYTGTPDIARLAHATHLLINYANMVVGAGVYVRSLETKAFPVPLTEFVHFMFNKRLINGKDLGLEWIYCAMATSAGNSGTFVPLCLDRDTTGTRPKLPGWLATTCM